MTKPLKIALAGLGTVGTGVIKILQGNADLLSQRSGQQFEIAYVYAKNKDKDRGVDLSDYIWPDDPMDMVSDDNVDIFIEMIGGTSDPAYGLVKTALENGKHVITPNKALLAEHGAELAGIAEDKGVSLLYEACVAGGIPIIKTLREGLAANNVTDVYGILNGTCNYMLTEMRKTGQSFDVILKEAQEKGYAEAEPSFDVDGIDAAHKTCLLGALAFGVKPDMSKLDIAGIRNVGVEDIVYAGELGYAIKLLGINSFKDGVLTQRVAPCLLPKENLLANVDDVLNAVYVKGDHIGQSLSIGPGAGEGATASAVVADLMDIARGTSINTFGVPHTELEVTQSADNVDINSAYYLRFTVKDNAGVFAQLSSILSDQGISMDTVLQKPHEQGESACIVIITSKVTSEKINHAVNKIKDSGVLEGEPRIFTVENL